MQAIDKNFDSVKVLYTNARRRLRAVNPAHRRHRIFMALVLVLTFGSTGFSLPVQAATAATEFRFFMTAKKVRGNAAICVGDNVRIRVQVMRAEVVISPGNLGYIQNLPGALVTGSVSNVSVGTLQPASIRTGFYSIDPGGAEFQFHADKVGTTSISFKGTINHIWWASKYLIGLPALTDRTDFVTDQVGITVEQCQYKVMAISHFSTAGVKLLAIMDGVLIKNEDGNLTGTAAVNWIGGPVTLGGCNGTMEVAPGQATLVGEQAGEQLIVDVTYHETTLGHLYNCIPGSVEIHPPVIPDPVSVTVPVSGGDIFGKDQNLSAPCYMCEEYDMSGFVNVDVTRVVQH